jgi:hypothetical protein
MAEGIYESRARDFIKRSHNYEKFINFKQHEEALFLIDKLLVKCEELRKAKENFKKKYIEGKKDTTKNI